MTGYGSRSVNVAQFLANGNSIPSDNDVSEDQQRPDLNDLEKFLNLEFTTTDYEAGDLLDFGLPLDEQEHAGKRQKIEGHGQDGSGGEGNGQGARQAFVNADFSFPGSHNPFDLPTSPSTLHNQPIIPDYTANPSYPYPQQPAHPAPIQTSPTSTSSYPSAPYTPTGSKHSLPQPPGGPQVVEHESESARLVAEEDKRRRNTAASARFRVKKKEREKALEKTAEELKKRAMDLEGQVEQLRNENKWLRELVVGRRDGVGIGVGGRVAASRKEEHKEESATITEEKKKGVGTEPEKEKVEAA